MSMETRTRRRSFLLPPDMVQWLALMAEQHQCTQEEIVRRALHEWFVAHGHPYVYLPPRDRETGVPIGWQPGAAYHLPEADGAA